MHMQVFMLFNFSGAPGGGGWVGRLGWLGGFEFRQKQVSQCIQGQSRTF